MKIPLEDLFEDIVEKAKRGLGLGDPELSQRTRLGMEELRALKSGSGDRSKISALAQALGLRPDALEASYTGSWYPDDVPAVEGVKQFNTSLLDMTVNAYLIWDTASKDAAVFDTGAGFKSEPLPIERQPVVRNDPDTWPEVVALLG